MDILFLGTGAADFNPALSMDVCFGLTDKSVRRSSAILINGSILVDCGPHVYKSIMAMGADVKKIKAIVLTHFHSDHFDIETLKNIVNDAGSVEVYYNKAASFENVKGVIKRPLAVGESFTVLGVKFTPLNANHTAHPFHYLIEEDGKSVFYATDGAWILYNTYYYLKNKNLSALIIDATVGDVIGDYRVAEHNSLPMIRLLTKSYKSFGIIGGDTKIYLTHIAVTLNPEYDKQVEIAKKDGFTVCYDGMKIKV